MKDRREKKRKCICNLHKCKKKRGGVVTQKLLRLILSREWVQMGEKNKMVTQGKKGGRVTVSRIYGFMFLEFMQMFHIL